jgi:multidrug transporter EmrE-like cation transporter
VTTPLSAILLVFSAAFIGSFGAVFLKWGAGRLTLDVRALLTNWRLATGIALYLISFVFYYLGLQRGELSVLFPMVSFGYIWTLLWSRIFFHEPFTRLKFTGIALILAGLCVLRLGSH